MASLRILLSGGGSGGHIYPALAIADAIRQLAPETDFLFIGAEGKMEMRRVPAAGYAIEGVPVSGFQRAFDKRNLNFPFQLVRGLGKAYRIVKNFKPAAAIGTGGFASGPALASAAVLGVPVFIQEQNAFPGVTNRLLGRVSTKIFTAYPEADSYFASAKTQHTGNPLRGSLTPDTLGTKEEGRVHFHLDPAKPTLLSFGGSQGARSMNEANANMLEFWQSHPELQLIWQTGEGYFARFSESETAQLPNVTCVPYLERMDLAYAAADLVACRAGALSISELQLLGKPALLIPSPNVAGDHQTANALAVEQAGGAKVILDADQVPALSSQLLSLLSNQQTLDTLSSNMKAMATPHAATTIAQEILKHVNA